MDSEVDALACPSPRHRIHFSRPCLETEHRHHFENNFFPHPLKGVHFTFSLPHRQMCLWQFLVTIISHKSNKHALNYISIGRDGKKNQMQNVG